MTAPGPAGEPAAIPAPPSRPPLAHLLPYLRPHRGTLAVAVGLSLLGALAALAQPLLVAAVITAVQEGQRLSGPVGLLVGTLVVGAGLGAAQSFLLQRTAESVVLGTRRRLVDRLLHLPVAELDRRRVGDLISRVGADTTLLRAVVTSGLVDLVGSVLVVVGAVVAMALVDPVLLATALACVAVSVVGVAVVARRIHRVTVVAQTRVGSNEQALRQAVEAVAVDRTVLVVAHRLSTVVATDPLYRELANTQLLA